MLSPASFMMLDLCHLIGLIRACICCHLFFLFYHMSVFKYMALILCFCSVSCSALGAPPALDPASFHLLLCSCFSTVSHLKDISPFYTAAQCDHACFTMCVDVQRRDGGRKLFSTVLYLSPINWSFESSYHFWLKRKTTKCLPTISITNSSGATDPRSRDHPSLDSESKWL